MIINNGTEQLDINPNTFTVYQRYGYVEGALPKVDVPKVVKPKATPRKSSNSKKA